MSPTFLLSCVSAFAFPYPFMTLKDFLASNWVLKQFKPSRWLPFLVTLWGTVTTLSGLVQSYSGLLAIRFFLGLCEGGLLPGIVSNHVRGLKHIVLMKDLDALPEHPLQAT